MKLSRIVRELGLRVFAGEENLEVEVTRGYASDLLSDVIAHAEETNVWITLQCHQNIVAVAEMKSLGGIILVNGREPAQETVAKAREEGVPLLGSERTTFEIVAQLAALGIVGS